MVGAHVLVLGPVAARSAAGDAVPVTGKAATLLAVLTAAHPAAVPAPTLIEALWGDEPTPTAAQGLRVVAASVRRALRAGVPLGSPSSDPVIHGAAGYRMHLPADAIDADRFERLFEDSRRALLSGDHAGAAESIDGALGLWRGRAYGQLGDHDAVRAAATRLELLLLDAQDHRVDVQLAAGDAVQAATSARTLVDATPLREQRWVRLMLALYRSGRQAEALRAFQQARTLLVDELGVEPGVELRAMQRAVLQHAPALAGPPSPTVEGAARALRSSAERLPVPLTPLIGRSSELVALHDLLAGRRLVTIVGAGGAGKTRLAVAVAHARRAARSDVIFVPLADESATSMVQALADQMSVNDRAGEDLLETIVTHLRPARALVVLDNCEHVAVDAARLAHVLVSGCPELEVLATSRVPLRVEGEHRYPLGPLADADARALLDERASAAMGRPVEVDAADRVAIERVLDGLDRMPLAIELAASQLDTMSWAELEATVERGRGAMRNIGRIEERHRDLAATVAWSYDLLDGPTRHVFDGLAVMAGSFTAMDVAAVQALDGDVAGVALRHLANCSLVVADPGSDVTRFRVLETMRWFAAQRIGDRQRALVARLGDHVAATAHRLSTAIRGPQEAAGLRQLDDALDAMRSVFRRSVEDGDIDRAGELACDLWQFGLHRLHYDVLGFADDVLAMPGGDEHPRAGELYGIAGHRAWLSGSPGRALERARAGLARSRPQLGWSVPMAQGTIVNVAGYQGDVAQALAAWHELHEWARAQHDPYWLAGCQVILTIGTTIGGRPTDAAAAVARARRHAEEVDNPSTDAWVAYAGGIEAIERDLEEATGHFEHGVARARAVGNSWLLGMNLSGLATVWRRRQRLDPARAVLRELLVLWHRGNHLAQLRHALTEAALVLATDDIDGARLALAVADAIEMGYPLLPSDGCRLAALRDEVGSRDAWVGAIDGAVDQIVGCIG